MSNNDITFLIEGQDSEIIIEKIRKIVQKELNCPCTIKPFKDSASQETTKSLDPVAIGALVLAIPGAVLAVADLVERARSRKRMESVLDEIRKELQAAKKTTIRTWYPDGTVQEITETRSTELLDVFIKKDFQ